MKHYTPYLDGSSQEAFNKSFDNLLAYLLLSSEETKKYTRVRCLKCKHEQDYTGYYRCGSCGHDTGEMFE